MNYTAIKSIAFAIAIGACMLAPQRVAGQSLDKFDRSLRKEFISQYEQMSLAQKAVSVEAKETLLKFEKFQKEFKIPPVPAFDNLGATRLDLDDKIGQLDKLLAVQFADIAVFKAKDASGRDILPFGQKYLVIGPSELNAGIVAIRTRENDFLDISFKTTSMAQPQKTELERFDYFVVYGEKIWDETAKDAVIRAESLDGVNFWQGIEKDDYNTHAKTFHDKQIDIAGYYFFTRIVAGLKFEEKFATLDDSVSTYTAYLDETHSQPGNGGITFKQWRSGGIVQPPTAKCTYPGCGVTLNADGTCPNAANHGVIQPPPPPPENPLVKFLKENGLWVLIAAVAIVVVALLFKKPTTPTTLPPPPPPPPPPVCPSCGTPLVGGKCPKCATPPPPPPPPPGKCPRCGAALDAKGICPECTRVPDKPVSFHNFDEDATRVPAAFDLEIVAPAKWAGKYADRLPAKFEMGRYSATHLPPAGTPFCALNLEGHPDAARCSRRYLRFSMTGAKDGFNVDLLSENDCKVAGTVLRKGENAVAKAGDTIEIAPDWVFKVVPRK